MISSAALAIVIIGEKDCWGKGYAREALLKAIRYIIEERNIHRIQATVLESNAQSLNMHKKCGYKVDGLLRDSIYKNGKFQNQYVLSLLETDLD